MEPFLIQLLVPVISGVVLVMVIYGFKLPDLMKDNTNAIRNLTIRVEELFDDIRNAHDEIEINTKRHEVVQRIVGDMLEHPIDTKKIVENFQFYPPSQVFKKHHREQ